MSSITTINANDLITNSRADINNNFTNLNNDKVETSVLDTDNTLSANSDTKIPSQKAVKAYVDTGGNVNASETNKGIVEEATNAEVTAGTATGATGAKLFVSPAKLATRFTKATGAEVTTGTDDTKYVTAKAIKDSNVGSYWDFVYKLPSDFTVTNNATLQNVTGFTLPVLSGETWMIEVWGSTSANNGIGDISGDLITSGTWYNTLSFYEASYWGGTGTFVNSVRNIMANSTQAMSNPPINSGDLEIRAFMLRCVVRINTSGNVAFAIANTAAGSGRTSTMKAGSYMFARKLVN